ncbi:MAG: class I SAM-dependent methyltransferase [Pirellulales bacterium]|nr:class I SAM-dependent methyltransferase [Pirellulales bacterium]
MLARILEPEAMDEDREAEEYDAMDHGEVNRLFVADLLAAGPLGSDILDIGTGTALIPIEICKASDDEELRVMAVDLSVPMLDIAKMNIDIASMLDRIQLEYIDAKQTPFADAMFTTVLSNSIVHHLADPLPALAEAHRVVTPGGLLFFRDLARPESAEAVESLVANYTQGESELAQQLFRQSLHAALTVDEMRELIEKLGYDPKSVTQTSDRHWTWQARRMMNDE